MYYEKLKCIGVVAQVINLQFLQIVLDPTVVGSKPGRNKDEMIGPEMEVQELPIKMITTTTFDYKK